jgi:hypothetical protein
MNMFSKKKLRACGLAVSIVAAASMVVTPIYAAPGQSGQRVQFRTTAAALQVVQAQNPELYQRLLAYRSGQDVRVTPKERAYLQRINRMVAVAAQQTRATDFSSQSRKVSAEARQAFAQGTPPAEKKKTEVLVTKPWYGDPDWWNKLKKWSEDVGKISPIIAFFSPVAVGFIAAGIIIINLIVAIALAIIEALPKVKEALGR